MNEELKNEILGTVQTYISGTIDDLYGNVFDQLKDEKLNLKFHDVVGIVEDHLERAADNIYWDLEDMFKEKK